MLLSKVVANRSVSFVFFWENASKKIKDKDMTFFGRKFMGLTFKYAFSSPIFKNMEHNSMLIIMPKPISYILAEERCEMLDTLATI